MPSNALRGARRIRAEFNSSATVTPRRRRSDHDRTLQFGVHEPEARQSAEARLILYFAAVLACTVIGVGLEEMRLPVAAWSLFIIGAAFLLAAVRALFVAPQGAAKPR